MTIVKKIRHIARRFWNFRMLESMLSRLPETIYIRWIRVAYRFGTGRAPARDVYFGLGENGLWVVKERGELLSIPSYRRSPRYLKDGIPGVKRRLISRYFPDTSKRECLKGATVVDIGANIGEFSLACLDYGATRIVAIEPDDIPFKCLRDNLGRRAPNSILKKALVSDKPGRTLFYHSTRTADSSLIVPDEYTETSELNATTIDEMVASESIVIDLLKVEAEGAEPEEMRGASNVLREQSPYVTVRASCERQGKSTFDDCERILTDLGYICLRAGDGYQLLAVKPEQIPAGSILK